MEASLKEKLNNDLKDALRSGDKVKLGTIRMILSASKNAESAKKTKLVTATAKKAGIKSGDVIVEFNGKEVADAHSLQLMVSECAPGTEATVKLIRDGLARTITVTLGERPVESANNQNESGNSKPDDSKTDALDGVTVADLSLQTREQLKIPNEIKGALVMEVDPDSNSAEAGLKQGDIIVEINRQPVNNAGDAIKLCGQAKGDQILLKVWHRNGNLSGMHYLGVENTKKESKQKQSP